MASVPHAPAASEPATRCSAANAIAALDSPTPPSLRMSWAGHQTATDLVRHSRAEQDRPARDKSPRPKRTATPAQTRLTQASAPMAVYVVTDEFIHCGGANDFRLG